jgi:hypothetical protein
VSAKLSCLSGAFVLLSSVAALAQASIQVGLPPIPGVTILQPVQPLPPLLALTPGGTSPALAPGPSSPSIGIAPAAGVAPGPAGTLLSPIQNSPSLASIPPGCPGNGFSAGVLTLNSIFPPATDPTALQTFTPTVIFDRAIGC